jgi:hypothetical protein
MELNLLVDWLASLPNKLMGFIYQSAQTDYAPNAIHGAKILRDRWCGVAG